MIFRSFFFIIFCPLLALGRVCVQQKNPYCPINNSQRNISSLSDLGDQIQSNGQAIQMYITQPGENGAMISHETTLPISNSNSEVAPIIDIDSSKKYQSIMGFGAAVTESCITNMNRLDPKQRQSLMQKIFDPKKGAGFSYLRVPIGGNDFSSSEYSLDDTKDNKPDPELKHFNKAHLQQLIDFVKEAKKYNPNIQIMISPWTPPAWMKDNQNLDGGHLQKQYYGAYADYLAKSIEVLKSNGISPAQMSIMNEPSIEGSEQTWYFPQGHMSPADQTEFTERYLIPRLRQIPNAPKILLHDHNWDGAKSAIAYSNSKPMDPLIGGIAYHCYGGTRKNLQSDIQSQNPSLPSFNTECTRTRTQDNGQGSFQWWLENESLDAVRDGVSGSIGWNLCLNEKGGPHLEKGFPGCRGMVTIPNGSNPQVEFNAEFYATAQTTHYLQPGAVRIDSTDSGSTNMQNVAFKNPDGSKVLVIRNNSNTSQTFSTKVDGCSSGAVQVPAGGAVTLKWQD